MLRRYRFGFAPRVEALVVLAAMAGLSGCGTEPADSSPSTTSGAAANSAGDKGGVKIEFPDGDPSVPADLGGPGFKGGNGWQTASPGPLGDPRAKPGGELVSEFPAWPNTLRPYGIESNDQLNQVVINMCYESLCGLHPQTLETIPGLASHWWISPDKMTFRFRINPKAHWSDGKPVVAEDVRATYRLIMDPSLLEPNFRSTLINLKEPKVLSKYMVEVECKEKHWRNFLRITEIFILPAHEIAGLSGKDFLDKYKFAYTANSGPYIVRPEDINTEVSLTVTRRKDYWGDSLEMNRGLNNFSRIRFMVLGANRRPFDKVLKGDIDYYLMTTAKWWVEEVVGTDGKSPQESILKGHLIAQKVFTRIPEGFQGDAFNMRNAPLNDLRVRLALAHLFDRETMLASFAYNEYTPLKSYFPGSDYENPDNKMTQYDPAEALKLLAEAGYTERDTDGVLMRKGERLSVTLTYDIDGFSKYYTAYQQACHKVGVEIKLNLIDPPALVKASQERTFQMVSAAFGGGRFPDPRPAWHSSLADQRGSDNFPGIKDREADEVIDRYDHCFDLKERKVLLRRLDGILFNQHPYMLQWYVPCQRILWWNKFGMPKTVFTKYGDFTDAFVYWWYDPEKAAALEKARQSGEAIAPIPLPVLHPWNDDAAAADKPAGG